MDEDEGVAEKGPRSGRGDPGPGLTRRAVLRDGASVSVALLVAGPLSTLGDVAVAVERGRRAFLRPDELETLRALVDRLIPGGSEDTVEGAVAAGCAEAIDALLGAFASDPPRIYAGGPFSDRGGARRNHFERFVRLDAYEEKAWKLRIRGSRGRRRLEFNGPVKGWQRTYREGLAALDEAAGGDFASQPGLARDLILRTARDSRVSELVDIAFPHTFQFMYGAPEYGGNRDLLGWRITGYPGDVQPRGWTREEVEGPPKGAVDDLEDLLESLGAPVALKALAAIAPLGFPDAGHGVAVRSAGTLSGYEREVGKVLRWHREGGLDGP